MRISDYRNDRSMVEHCVLIFLKMSPQSRSETEPDLLLTMSKVQASFQN